MPDIVRHPLGVHLGMSHTEYLEDIGCGYSFMNDASKSVVEAWWASKWNPLRPAENPKAAYDRGTALHTLWLDGREAYANTVVVKPETYTDAKTGEVKRWHGGAEVCKKWLAEHDGFNIITADDDAAIQLVTRIAFQSPQTMDVEGGKVSIADAFEGGLHEVSVFWDEGGVPMRARFDVLKPNASIDLKSLTDWKRGDFKKGLLREILIRGYLTQAVHYHRGREELRKAVADGRVFGGTPRQREILQEIAEANEWGWVFIFGKLDGCPQARAIPINRQSLRYIRAQQKWEETLTILQYFSQTYGWENQWMDGEIVWEPEDIDWPAWNLED